MNENLFKLTLTIVVMLTTIITLYIVPYLKTKIDISTLGKITYWVSLAVKCAEQVFGENTGVEKKQFVVKFINDLFNKKREVIKIEQIEVILESIVCEMNKNK